MHPKVSLQGPVSAYQKDLILNPQALDFIAHLAMKFQTRREQLLVERAEKVKDWAQGKKPSFLASTKSIRESSWSVVSVPGDLQDRRVEITGPADKKMMINALNSGAKVFMADLEDACSPTWDNILQSLDNLSLAVRRKLEFSNADGRTYKLNPSTATLIVRPRGWHLEEAHLLINHKPISASLFDFGLYFFHNAKELLERGSGPYFYLPKMESHLEARLWNDVFKEAELYLGIPPSSIRATALIETITAAYEMEEILWELKDYIIGLNAGRWDYLFSIIKKFGHLNDCVFPDRQQLTMNVPFMRTYAQALVQVCHKRKAHAIGGMSAFIPNRKNPEINEKAFEAVRNDKLREVADGFDGTWVAHPDLVPIAQNIFDAKLGNQPHQKNILREDYHYKAEDLLQTKIENSSISLQGFQNNIRIALEYTNQWLGGLGAVAIDNLMEDMATAEISRAQLWQWVKHHCQTKEGVQITQTLYFETQKEILNTLSKAHGMQNYERAAELLDELVLSNDCPEFLSLLAYKFLSKV